MIRILTRRHEAAAARPPGIWRSMMFLRRSKTPRRPIYEEAAAVLKSRCHREALTWFFENLKPEAARMIETCLSAYGPTEALRWISYWEEKKEPIEKEPKTIFSVGDCPRS